MQPENTSCEIKLKNSFFRPKCSLQCFGVAGFRKSRRRLLCCVGAGSSSLTVSLFVQRILISRHLCFQIGSGQHDLCKSLSPISLARNQTSLFTIHGDNNVYLFVCLSSLCCSTQRVCFQLLEYSKRHKMALFVSK